MAYGSNQGIACPNCGHNNPTSARYCNQCTTALPQFDPHAPAYRIFSPRGRSWSNPWARTFASAEEAAEQAAGTDRWKGAFVGLTTRVGEPTLLSIRYTVQQWLPLIHQPDDTYTLGEQPADAPTELDISGEE